MTENGGPIIIYWIIDSKFSVIPWSTIISLLPAEMTGRTLGETFTSTRDLWGGDIKSIPFEPSYEEAAMEELDKYIGQQTTIKKSDGSCILLHG